MTAISHSSLNSSATSPPLSALKTALVETARQWIGTPYHPQNALKGVGCDCFGLIRGIFKEVYGKELMVLPPYDPSFGEYSPEEYLLNIAEHYFSAVPVEKAEAGDLLLFRMRRGTIAKHCGFLASPRTFIHAQSRYPVSESFLTPWWEERLVGSFAFPPLPIL